MRTVDARSIALDPCDLTGTAEAYAQLVARIPDLDRWPTRRSRKSLTHALAETLGVKDPTHFARDTRTALNHLAKAPWLPLNIAEHVTEATPREAVSRARDVVAGIDRARDRDVLAFPVDTLLLVLRCAYPLCGMAARLERDLEDRVIAHTWTRSGRSLVVQNRIKGGAGFSDAIGAAVQGTSSLSDLIGRVRSPRDGSLHPGVRLTYLRAKITSLRKPLPQLPSSDVRTLETLLVQLENDLRSIPESSLDGYLETYEQQLQRAALAAQGAAPGAPAHRANTRFLNAQEGLKRVPVFPIGTWRTISDVDPSERSTANERPAEERDLDAAGLTHERSPDVTSGIEIDHGGTETDTATDLDLGPLMDAFVTWAATAEVPIDDRHLELSISRAVDGFLDVHVDDGAGTRGALRRRLMIQLRQLREAGRPAPEGAR